MDWGQSNYVNPPFRKDDGLEGKGVMAFVRKAIAEAEKGKTSVIIMPVFNYIATNGLRCSAAGVLGIKSGQRGRRTDCPVIEKTFSRPTMNHVIAAGRSSTVPIYRCEPEGGSLLRPGTGIAPGEATGGAELVRSRPSHSRSPTERFCAKLPIADRGAGLVFLLQAPAMEVSSADELQGP
jgi:hypothetical protein